ncbi:MAG: pyroglutamyl-peptidase I [Candidatus Bathyarchaeia archaeon]
MSKTILLTGFEPFGGSEVNPSISACMELAEESFNGYKVKVEEIPLHYKEIKSEIEGLIELHDPAAVISTGQSSRPVISLERVAINIASARIEYNCGEKPIDEELVEDGPVAYFTGLPFRSILETLKQAKIPAEISNTAGTFGCNQIFYHLMDYIDREKLSTPAGFIHVPPLPEQVIEKNKPSMSLDTIARALRVVTDTIALDL